jgi:GTPase SAR1 family protein
MPENPELKLAFEFVQYTNRNIFLTGKAGTGKTTFLKSLKENSPKRMVVLAPTGVAAINAGGVTIHSFFQLPFGPMITERVAGRKMRNPDFQQKFNKRKINIIKTLDLLVIDEVSMVRADVLDAIDDILRRYKNRFLPFGGVQVLMIGDMQQLPPVVKRDEWEMFREFYPSQSMYFFYAKVLKEISLVTIELKHVYRQADENFIRILNEIRDDRLTKESYELLHSRYIPGFKPSDDEGYITLTTHNAAADVINENRLAGLKGKPKIFKAEVDGNFSEYAYPTDYELKLKEGAQVMFVKNDPSPEKNFYNGKVGKITLIDGNTVFVKCPEDDYTIEVNPLLWENIKYGIDRKSGKITEDVEGTFKQIPLRLAWAITIHKSQGLTFEKAVIDAHAAFAHGQTYVALSRCKSLEGLVLSSRISQSAIICDSAIAGFNKRVEENQPTEDDLQKSKFAFQKETISDIFNYKQLSYRLEHLERNIENHAKTIHGNLREKLMSIQRDVMPALIGVADKFMVQVNSLLNENPDAENNKQLIERLKKAGEYFYKEHEEKIVKVLNDSVFESDNKNTKKIIEEDLDAVYELMKVRQECLEVLKSRFSVKKIMEARAKAALDGKKQKKKKTGNYKGKHSELLKLLVFWRNEMVEMLQVPHYRVASYETLTQIAEKLPCTEKQLGKIKGIGKTKLNMFGDDILDMVLDYIEENGLECGEDEVEAKVEVKVEVEDEDEVKVEVKKSYELSFELFNSGLTVDEIAKKMKLTRGTVEGHLSRYVASGELDIAAFVSKEKVNMITEYFEKFPDATLSMAKHNLPDDISWGDLKMVKAMMA